MAKSLQEQLMGSGLVDKKKAKTIQKEKRAQRKKLPKGQEHVDEVTLRAAELKKEKADKDRELNRLREQQKNIKAIQAQIKQLIESNSITSDGDIGFQFSVDKKIKKIYISADQQTHLLKGRLAITSIVGEFKLVPSVIAEKLLERDKNTVVYLQDKSQQEDTVEDEDDPYKDFQIPDDLMW
jgi:uncharacterized protein YaiL (DUF2058 family)